MFLCFSRNRAPPRRSTWDHPGIVRHLEVSPYLADKKKQVRIDCRCPRRDTCEFSGCQGLDQQKRYKKHIQSFGDGASRSRGFSWPQHGQTWLVGNWGLVIPGLILKMGSWSMRSLYECIWMSCNYFLNHVPSRIFKNHAGSKLIMANQVSVAESDPTFLTDL